MFKFIDTNLKDHVEVDAIDRDGTRFYLFLVQINIIRV